MTRARFLPFVALPAPLTPTEAEAARVRFAPGVRIRHRRGQWVGTVIARPEDAEAGISADAFWFLPDAEQPKEAYPMPAVPSSREGAWMVDEFEVLP